MTIQPIKGEETLRQQLAGECEQQQARQMFDDCRHFEHLLIMLSTIFVNASGDKIDHAIQQSLQQVAEYLGADRVSFLEFSADQHQFQISHTYIVANLPVLQETIVASARFPWCMERSQRGEVVEIFDINDLPREAETDKQQFQQFGIQSIVILPIVIGKAILCALTVSTLRERRRWTAKNVARLQLISEIFANGLNRKRAWQQDEERLRIERLIADLSAEFINLPPDRVDARIDMGLRRIVESLPGADRCTFAEFSPDRAGLIATHSFAVTDFQPYPLGNVNDTIPWITNNMQSGEILRISGVDSFPAEADLDRKNFLDWGLKASLFIPLRVGGNVTFALSMSSLQSAHICADEAAQRLQIIGEIFANALIRKQNEESLNNALTELKELRDRLLAENLYLHEAIQLRNAHKEIIGESPAMQAVLYKVEQVAATNSTVLLQGETGTGKQLIAQTIHNLSTRKRRPMLTVNCAALPPALIESALFGHEKGAFTGALRKKNRLFRSRGRLDNFFG